MYKIMHIISSYQSLPERQTSVGKKTHMKTPGIRIGFIHFILALVAPAKQLLVLVFSTSSWNDAMAGHLLY